MSKRSAVKVVVATISVILSVSLTGPASAQISIPGSWLAVTDMFGNRLYQTLLLQPSASPGIIGSLDGDPLTGIIENSKIHFVVKDSQNTTYEMRGTLEKDQIIGSLVITETGTPNQHTEHTFSAKPVAERPAGPPRVIEFSPTIFSNRFSSDIAPVITIWPGDTIQTKTIDSGGVDEHGVTRALYGNPQTGPFFIGGARAGDLLAVHIKRLTLNRDYADSLDAITDRAKTSRLSVKANDLGKPVRWTLDREKGVAKPTGATGHLKNYSVPLHPMLGCVGVAPAFGFAPFSTGEEGRYGGNMDYNAVTEGSTVYLNVTQPGALLYLGDAHAAMGDGETTEWALETSMDVEFQVEVIPAKSIATPRVETGSHIAALGFGGSIDEATRRATAGMVQWLEQDYNLTPSESAQVLGTAAEYVISEVADRDAGVVLKLKKDILKTLRSE